MKCFNCLRRKKSIDKTSHNNVGVPPQSDNKVIVLPPSYKNMVTPPPANIYQKSNKWFDGI